MLKKIFQFNNQDNVKMLIAERCNIVFEERVLFNCFFCKNYGYKWSCPPNIPNLTFSTVLNEYDNYVLLFHKKKFENEITIDDRIQSTSIIHMLGLKLEKILWENNHPMAKIFIGGGCKLCTNCPKTGCVKPYFRRIPLEAIGVNVIKTAANVGMEIVFPPKDYFYRVGLLVW